MKDTAQFSIQTNLKESPTKEKSKLRQYIITDAAPKAKNGEHHYIKEMKMSTYREKDG